MSSVVNAIIIYIYDEFNLYYDKATLDTRFHLHCTKTESYLNYYKILLLIFIGKASVFNKTEINDQVQELNTALTFASGPFYIPLPLSTHGVLIWGAAAETPKVKSKLNLSKFYTAVEMTRDFKVNRLSGNVLQQMDNMIVFVKTRL